MTRRVGSRLYYPVLLVLLAVVILLAAVGGSTSARLVSRVEGANGSIVVRFALPGARTLEDFAITRTVGRGAPEPVTASQLSVERDGRIARLTVPALAPAAQVTASYQVSVRGSAQLSSSEFDVARAHTIVSDGVAHAVLVRDPNATSSVRTDVSELQRLIAKATGANLEIIEPAGVGQAREAGLLPIWVGVTDPSEREELTRSLTGKGSQALLINSNTSGITLTGNSDLGIHYAALEFSERFLGVRWLMAGDIGEDVPPADNLTVPQLRAVDAPAIESRVIYPLHLEGNAPQTKQNFAWGQRARIVSSTPGYSHNLWRIFQPTVGEPSQSWPTTHPEYYPRRNGVPFVPRTQTRWQPNFSDPGTVTAAVEWINNYFDEFPQESGFSLAVNDGGGFAESEPDHPNHPNRKNSFGYNDMSDIYYAWVNAVVAGVLAQHPDKTFGVLAYGEVADPPSFPLNPRVIPYLTKERLTWIDAGEKAKGEAQMAAWRAVSENVAFYDYAYGSYYMIPRVYPHQMSSYLRDGVDQGMTAYFGEGAPTWGEGPKLYEWAKLLWNPQRNVDAELDEWYVRTAGADAAPYLKKYFEFSEYFWTTRIKDTDWFKTRKGLTYLSFFQPDYLQGLQPSEIDMLRGYLEQARGLTHTPEQQARVQLVMQAFGFTEASLKSYPAPVVAPSSQAQALALVARIESIASTKAWAARRTQIYRDLAQDPWLAGSSTLAQLSIDWSGLDPDLLWTLAAYVQTKDGANGPVRQRLQGMANTATDSLVASYASATLRAADRAWAVTNPSFEAGTAQASGWTPVVRSFGAFTRQQSPAAALTGVAGIGVQDFFEGELRQNFAARPGLVMGRLRYFVANRGFDLQGDIGLTVRMLDAAGNVLGEVKGAPVRFNDFQGSWASVSVGADIPSQIRGIGVTSIQVAAAVNGFQEGASLYLDDFTVVAGVLPSRGEIAAVTWNGQRATVATNGIVGMPTASDFVVTQRIIGAGSTPVVPAGFSWNPTNRTATFDVPTPPSQPWQQNVTVAARYRNSATVFSAPSVVAADTAGWIPAVSNPSLEQWPNPATSPTGWEYWGPNRYRRGDTGRTGAYAMVCTGFTAEEVVSGGGSVRQRNIPVSAGRYGGSVSFRAPSGAEGTVQILLLVRDVNGTVLRSIAGTSVAVSESKGGWVTAWATGTVEAAIGGVSPATIDFLVVIQGVPQGSQLTLDDLSLTRRSG